MIIGTHVIGASLIALLVDRLILARRLGSTPFSTASTKVSVAAGIALPVFFVVVISSAVSSAIADFALRPLCAAYLYPVVFTAAIVATAFAGEGLLTKWQSPEVRNRISGRTTIAAAILGFLVLVPFGNVGAPDTLSCAKGILDAVLSGAVFLGVTFLWNGIREKIDLMSDTKKPLSLAQELVAAGLIALVLLSISSLHFFHA